MGQVSQPVCIFDSCGRIVKGAWSDNDEEAVILLGNDSNRFLPTL